MVPTTPGDVYFASFDGRSLKVGFSTSVSMRLRQMQSSSPVNAALVDVFPGTPADEARVHFLLKDHRLKREWFEWTDEVEDFVSDLMDARITLQLEHGADYDPTIRECLDALGLPEIPAKSPTLRDVKRATKAAMNARLARLRLSQFVGTREPEGDANG